jgi:ABC-type multidrug transport system ATPase subunit
MSDTSTPSTSAFDQVILDRPGGTLTSTGDLIVENDLTDAEFEAALESSVKAMDEGRIIEHDRMATVLRKLHSEVFVLNPREPVAAAPTLPGYAVRLADDGSIEVEVTKSQNLNDIFAALSARGIEVVSMRNKSNRLEELFRRLVEGRDVETGLVTPAVPA